MKKFTVGITRIGYGFKDIEVEADNQEEADQKALNIAGNFEFSEKNADYELENGKSDSKPPFDHELIAAAIQGAITMISDLSKKPSSWFRIFRATCTKVNFINQPESRSAN